MTDSGHPFYYDPASCLLSMNKQKIISLFVFFCVWNPARVKQILQQSNMIYVSHTKVHLMRPITYIIYDMGVYLFPRILRAALLTLTLVSWGLCIYHVQTCKVWYIHAGTDGEKFSLQARYVAIDIVYTKLSATTIFFYTTIRDKIRYTK